MRRAALLAILISGFSGCFFDDHRHGGDTGGSGGWGQGGAGGGGGAQGGGYCSPSVSCGGGLVCDTQSGACASPVARCGSASFTPKRASGEILLVLDRSNSMHDRTPTGSKWSDLGAALQQILADTGGQIKWGLEMFPGSDSQACSLGGIDVAPSSNTVDTIMARIAAATPTGAGTPTRDALSAAADYLGTLHDGAQKYILLATDGEPNCSESGFDSNDSDAPATIAAVRQVAARGVSTFVIGVSADAQADATLSQLAQAGGEARQGMAAYFPATSLHDLEAALGVVARQVALCTFDLNPAPSVGNTIELQVGGRAFPRDMHHTGDGWDFTNGGHSIALYGAACDAVQAGGAISAQYACAPGSLCNPQTQQCVPTPGGGGTGGYGGTGGAGGVSGTGGSCGCAGAGGSGGAGGVGEMCHYNAQCGPGGVCMGGMCMPSCAASSQCGTGDICSNGHCAPCPNPGGQCTFNGDCAGNATCINAFCHTNCATGADCPNPADICDHGICQPSWHRVPTCTSNAQCAAGTACVDGICRKPCWTDGECTGASSGPVCHTGYCFQANQASPQCFLDSDCGSSSLMCVDAACSGAL